MATSTRWRHTMAFSRLRGLISVCVYGVRPISQQKAHYRRASIPHPSLRWPSCRPQKDAVLHCLRRRMRVERLCCGTSRNALPSVHLAAVAARYVRFSRQRMALRCMLRVAVVSCTCGTVLIRTTRRRMMRTRRRHHAVHHRQLPPPPHQARPQRVLRLTRLACYASQWEAARDHRISLPAPWMAGSHAARSLRQALLQRLRPMQTIQQAAAAARHRQQRLWPPCLAMQAVYGA